jgi:hypothetical protein
MKENFNDDFANIYEGETLLDINLRSIEICRKALNISVPMIRSSQLRATGSKTELLVNICKELKATTYLSGPSGRDYLDMEFFDNAGIKVVFFEPDVNNYYSTLYNIKRGVAND